MSSGTDLANPRKSVESDHGCTSKIYFDNAADNVTPTSQKPCKHNITRVIAAKQTVANVKSHGRIQMGPGGLDLTGKPQAAIRFMILTPLEEQLDPIESNCSSREVSTALIEIC